MGLLLQLWLFLGGGRRQKIVLWPWISSSFLLCGCPPELEVEIDEQRSQRTGYVEAFLRPEIVAGYSQRPVGQALP